ncbi:MAG: transglutaminaseTgpA domain-containing protein, partial [Pseudobdellovibrionaceae bacterium]
LYLLLWSFLRIQTQNAKHFFLVKQVLASIPITILIFFLFPRFTHNFGTSIESNRSGSGAGFSGLAESLKPGSITQLFQSNDLVFRARFRGVEPRANDLYWRGEVLELNDGFEWKKHDAVLDTRFENEVKKNPTAKNSKFKLPSERISYQITIEPHQSRWAFALERNIDLRGTDLTESNNQSGVYFFDYPLLKRQTYSGDSNNEGYISMSAIEKRNEQALKETSKTIFPPLVNFEKRHVQLTSFSAGVDNLVKEFKSKIPEQASRLDKAQFILDYFSKNNFQYTLSPGDEAQDLEAFLTRGKKGFCEHYASAFVSLARALGVPSRVVVGYHGGAYNPVGGFWNITQKNAHAWAEVLIESNVWIRIDPTTVLPSSETQAIFNLASFSTGRRNNSDNLLIKLYDDTLLFLETMNFRWNEFFLDFNQVSQKDLYDEISNNLKNIGSGLMVIFLIYLIVKKTLSWLQHRNHRNRIEGIYDEISSTLKRPAHLGPMEWYQSMEKAQYPFTKEIFDIIECYNLNTYAMKPPSPQKIRDLRKALSRILSKSNHRPRSV